MHKENTVIVLIAFLNCVMRSTKTDLVFAVVGNDDTHKQSQANHVAEEDKQMDVNGFNLQGV